MRQLIKYLGTLFIPINLSYITLARTPHPCYYDVNKLASDDLIPCYPSIFSTHYSCCLVGDKCLRHNACYDSDTGISYQYGCTDPTFQDAHCPQKCGLDTEKSHWVGLIFCNGEHNTPSDMWVCHHPDNCGSYADCLKKTWKPELEHLRDSDCFKVDHGSQYVAFTESSTLSDIAALPVSTELSSWWRANSDRTKATITSISAPQTTTSLSSAVPGVSWPVTSSTSSPDHQATSSPNTPSPASSPSKAAAIGLGVGVGIPALLGLAGLTYFFTRRHHKKTQPEPIAPPSPFPTEKGESGVTYTHTGDAAAGYGHKSELDGTPIVEIVGSPRVSELPGSVAGTPFVSPETVQEEFGGEEEDEKAKRVSELPG